MTFRFNPRTWHASLAIIISIPLFTIAITALLIANGPALGLRDIKIDASWLPGYREAAKQDPRRDTRALLSMPDGLWLGTRGGLFRPINGQLQSVAVFEGQEIRALLPGRHGPLVLTQQGLWAERNGDWKQIHRGPVVNAFMIDGVLYAALRDKGLKMTTNEGKTWEDVAAVKSLLSTLPATSSSSMQITAARLVKDIHTGEALLGREGGWIWENIVAGALAFLVLSGTYLWLSGQQRKAAAKNLASRRAMEYQTDNA